MIEKIKKIIFGEKEKKHEYSPTGNPFNEGSTGTEIYSGYYAEEYLTSLRNGADRAKEYDKMRRSSSQVQMLLSSMKNPIKSCVWDIHPAEQDNVEYAKHAALIHRAFFSDMKCGWPKFLNESLTLAEFGHSVFERTHRVIFNDPELGTYITINDLSWRSPKTIERWNFNKCSELESISQNAFGDLGKMVDIPACNLIIFTLNMEGSDYQGQSMLRACYGNWFRQNIYMKLNAIGIEKFAIPTPIATIPKGLEGSPQKVFFEEALEKYTTHQSNYLMKPEGFEIQLNTNTYDPQKVEVSIDNEDKRMSKAFLANFLELGQGSGSYALSNDLSDFFLSALDYIATDIIADKLNQTIVKELIDLNFPGVTKYPKIVASGVSDKAGKELSDILNSLAGSKVIIPDDKLEDEVRQRFGLPERSMEGQRDSQPQLPTQQFGLSEKFRFLNRKRYKK